MKKVTYISDKPFSANMIRNDQIFYMTSYRVVHKIYQILFKTTYINLLTLNCMKNCVKQISQRK